MQTLLTAASSICRENPNNDQAGCTTILAGETNYSVHYITRSDERWSYRMGLIVDVPTDLTECVRYNCNV